MKSQKILKIFLFSLLSLILIGCGATTPQDVRKDLDLPVADMEKLAKLNKKAVEHPHDLDILVEFGDQLYASGKYNKAYTKWNHVLDIESDHSEAQQRIDRGIVEVLD